MMIASSRMGRERKESMTQDLIAKIDKLPKWAIEYINGLNQNIAELTKHVPSQEKEEK